MKGTSFVLGCQRQRKIRGLSLKGKHKEREQESRGERKKKEKKEEKKKERKKEREKEGRNVTCPPT